MPPNMLDRVKGIEAFPSVGGVGGLQDVMEPMSHLITPGGLERHANITHTHTHARARTHTHTHTPIQSKACKYTPLNSPQSLVWGQATQHNDIINSRTLVCWLTVSPAVQVLYGSTVAGFFFFCVSCSSVLNDVDVTMDGMFAENPRSWGSLSQFSWGHVSPLLADVTQHRLMCHWSCYMLN